MSRRDREVLKLLADGHGVQATATRFVMSMPTVRIRVGSFLIKLEVN